MHNDSKNSTVAVVGLGKIGLPLAVQYAQHGRRVIGCDSNPAVVATVNAGHSHVEEEPGLATEVARLVESGLLSATTHTGEAVRQAQVVVVIVPVAVDGRGEVHFRALYAASRAVGAGLQPGALVIYETTLPVGTTAGRVREILERARRGGGHQSGQHAALRAHSLTWRRSRGALYSSLPVLPALRSGEIRSNAQLATRRPPH
jgi:nucleotide sugar dehydrogenase